MYTFNRRIKAWTVTRSIVIVPDQIYGAQWRYDGRTFPVRKMGDKCGRARLCGDLYALHTAGTGDMVVRILA